MNNMQREKDPLRQWQGKVSKAKGKAFENMLDATFMYYKNKGFAIIEKTPEPMRPVRPLGGGRFEAFFEKKAQPDYKGTIKGGRTVMFEAKFTSSDRMEQNRVSPGQTEYMESHTELGAKCYVIVGFQSGNTYLIPWSVWRNMKEYFGRKYIKETDLDDYKLKTAWNGVLLILN